MKVICDKHGDVTAVCLVFLDNDQHKHPKEFRNKGVCFYCLAESIKTETKTQK